jgi:hypothetical protein
MRDIPTSPRILEIRRKTRKRFLGFLLFLFIFFVVIILGFSYFTKIEKLKINNIKVEGVNIINDKDIVSFVNEEISGKYFFIFQKSNFLIYPHNHIYNNLLVSFPRIETLEINRNSFNNLEIKIKERSGTYLYCGGALPENEKLLGDNCYFVNSDGYIFDRAPYFSGDIYFKFYSQIDKIEPIGASIFGEDNFYKFIRFIDSIKKLGLNPVYVVMNGEENSLFLEKKQNKINPRIIWKNEDSLDAVLEDISLAMKEEEFANEINSKYDTLSYIDLRFDNKVIYKFE